MDHVDPYHLGIRFVGFLTAKFVVEINLLVCSVRVFELLKRFAAGGLGQDTGYLLDSSLGGLEFFCYVKLRRLPFLLQCWEDHSSRGATVCCRDRTLSRRQASDREGFQVFSDRSPSQGSIEESLLLRSSWIGSGCKGKLKKKQNGSGVLLPYPALLESGNHILFLLPVTE